MSNVINANPVVYDVSLIPTRQSKKSDTTFLLEYKELALYDLALAQGCDEIKEVKKKLINIFEQESSVSTIKNTGDDDDDDENGVDEIDNLEIYDLICDISDPEHPLSLAALGVVNIDDIFLQSFGDLSNGLTEVIVKITPTINHCSLATLIGLGLRVRLERCLPPRFRITILLKEGSHQSENQVNSQLNDKERISAACENNQLLSVISTMLSTCK